MKKLTIWCFIIITNIFLSCGVTDTEENLQPGRRDYVWSVDTISNINGLFHKIWGYSPNSIWAVSTGGVVDYARFWFYNGTNWDKYTKADAPSEPNCLFGFSADDVYSGGSGGQIYHYNGNAWSRIYKYPIIKPNPLIINAVYGLSNTDLYAVGDLFLENGYDRKGIVLHYDGSNWTEIGEINDNCSLLILLGDNKKLFVFGNNIETDKMYLYKVVQNKIEKIKEMPSGPTILARIQGGNYLFIDNTLYKMQGNKAKEIVQIKLSTAPIFISGRSESDLFINTHEGIYHYNGQDYEKLYSLSNEYQLISDPLILQDDVFFLAYGNSRNLIIHGKLK